MPSEMPAGVGGMVPTLNKMGWMTAEITETYSREFVDFAPIAPGPALEIGASYGVASFEIISRGFKVTANDLDNRHLEILASRVPPSKLANLTLLPGEFPDRLRLADNHYGAILAARIFHFFEPDKFVRAIKALYRALIVGGKAFVVTESPYGKITQPVLCKKYEERKRAGDSWPGYFGPGEFSQYLEKDVALHLPSQFHFLDPETLEREGRNAGFNIETCEIFGRPDYPDWARFDGRESCGVVLRK